MKFQLPVGININQIIRTAQQIKHKQGTQNTGNQRGYGSTSHPHMEAVNQNGISEDIEGIHEQ